MTAGRIWSAERCRSHRGGGSRTTRRSRCVLPGLGVLLAVAAGCGGDASPPAAAGPVPAGGIDPATLSADCVPAFPREVKPPVPGLIGPASVAVESVADRGPGKIVTGFVNLPPDAFVGEAVAREGWTVVHRESEGVDSEVMITDGEHRVLWSLRIACPSGSTFEALVAKEDEEGRRFIVPPRQRL